MTLRYKISLWFAQTRHHLLHFLSSTYRESYNLYINYDSERAEHSRTRALLHNAEAELAEAKSQIQSLTISAQSAAAEAARMRDERDASREQAIAYLDRLTQQHQPVMDWIAQGCPRHPIFGAGPKIAEPPPVTNPDAPLGRVHGRKLATEINRATIEEMRRKIEEHPLPEAAQEEVAV